LISRYFYHDLIIAPYYGINLTILLRQSFLFHRSESHFLFSQIFHSLLKFDINLKVMPLYHLASFAYDVYKNFDD